MSYTFIHIQTDILDPDVDGSDKEVTFKCENFLYYARCFEEQLQYVKGERPDSYMNWPTPPTEEEADAHHERRHIFNQDQSIVQDWINSL